MVNPRATHQVTLPRALVVLATAAAGLVVLAGLRQAGDLVASVMLALVLAIAVAPLTGWARRHGWPVWAATVLALVAVYGVVALLVGGLLLSAVELAAQLPQYAPSARELSETVSESLADLGIARDTLQAILSQFDLGRLASSLTSYLQSLLGALSSLFFLVTLLFFLCTETTGIALRLTALTQLTPRVAHALTGFTSAVLNYLVVSTAFGAIVAVLDGVALWILGIPLPLVWALLSFLTNFIPNIGFVIGVIPPALLGLLTGGWQAMLAVLVVYSVLNLVIQTLIQPRVIGDAVGLNATITFLSLALWSYVLGPLGALLAIPLTLLAKALLVDPDPDARWAAVLLGSGRPPPTVTTDTSTDTDEEPDLDAEALT